MANSPDPSVWRKLAIALGDGLAFGVGVKLTRVGARQPGAPLPETGPLLERFAEMERRLEAMCLALPGPASPPPAAGFNRQALEGVARTLVDAFDARLQEQAERMEQRLARFQSRLDHQDAPAATASDSRIAEVQAGYRELAAEFRERLEAECAALDERLTAVHGELCQALPRAADAAVERELAGLKLAADNQEREIAGLRASLAQSDSRMMELLEAIAQVVRAAARISPPAAVPPEDPPPAAGPEPAAESAAGAAPPFAPPAKPAKLCQVSLVSSLVVAFGALALCGYL